jgi:RNA polymerase sigma-70 factor, ECF subfamily
MVKELKNAVSDAQKGDLASFGIVYDHFIQKIYDYIYYRTRHKQIAEDLASLTFTKALNNINDYSPNKGELSAWLYRIARNSLIDYYRTSRSTSDINDAFELGTESNFASDLDSQAKLDEVKAYLNQLPKEHRDLVVMRVWDNLSYAEIAQITGKSEASLKMSVSRILTKLRSEVVAVLIVYLTLL